MKTIHVAAAIICDKDKVLAAQRGYGEFKDGWEFPGGKLEPGETGAEACIREIDEELHVAIGNLEPLCTVEHENLRWLDAAHIWDVDWLPADVKVVKALEGHLAN